MLQEGYRGKRAALIKCAVSSTAHKDAQEKDPASCSRSPRYMDPVAAAAVSRGFYNSGVSSLSRGKPKSFAVSSGTAQNTSTMGNA